MKQASVFEIKHSLPSAVATLVVVLPMLATPASETKTESDDEVVIADEGYPFFLADDSCSGSGAFAINSKPLTKTIKPAMVFGKARWVAFLPGCTLTVSRFVSTAGLQERLPVIQNPSSV